MLVARYTVFLVVICLTAICAALSLVSLFWLLPAAVFLALSLLGVRDVLQTRSAIIHNYPVVGHVRFLFETFRPEIRQHLLEGDGDEEPFSREMRILVYQRAKGEEDKRPFGTTQKVYESGYAWLTHSIAAKHIPDKDFRTTIGGPECTQPYESSLCNQD